MSKFNKLYTLLVIVTMVVVIGVCGVYFNSQLQDNNVGSIVTGQEYNATTTPIRSGGWQD